MPLPRWISFAPAAPAVTQPAEPAPSGPTTVATLVLSAGSQALTAVPYSATVIPRRGQVPAGSTLRCATDTALRAAVVATHTDGSASVVVVSGAATLGANASIELPLHVQTAADTPLTAAAVSGALTNITVNFGGTFGVGTITDFSAPAIVWWASSATICARYYLPAPVQGGTKLEAVIDVQVWAGGKATVEVVLENSRMASATPLAPAAASYTAASVTVNGGAGAVSLGSAASAPEGEHTAFRATYARADIGWTGDLRATQKHTELQLNPMLFRIEQPATADLTIYGADTYAPWTAGRQRPTNMGGGGDHESIGYLPKWAAQALQSGDRRCWRATEVSDLACLGWNINYRDQATGLVPTVAQMGNKAWTQAGYTPPLAQEWPWTTNPSNTKTWEPAHHPAAGLMGMLSRASPVFLELTQKVAAFCILYSAQPYPKPVPWGQVRNRAWTIRSIGHALFMTPDALTATRTGLRDCLAGNAGKIVEYKNHPSAKLGFVWDYAPDEPLDHRPAAGFQCSIWQHHFLLTALHSCSSAQLLPEGTGKTTLDTAADWAALQPVRFINEQVNTWAYVSHETTVGTGVGGLGSPNTYGELAVMNYGAEKPPTDSFWTCEDTDIVEGFFKTTTAVPGYNYPRVFCDALHCAIERGAPGASTAWAKLNAAFPTHAQWRASFGLDPRHGRYARTL